MSRLGAEARTAARFGPHPQSRIEKGTMAPITESIEITRRPEDVFE
jgi:hypothetical protein